ncbi:outer membrane putative beta-barrel porin/alpha-amylase [Sphingomonas sp. PP-F2F-A104-K0414]|nr:transporter [Sphingomonas sp. PP-F2F-A104-K0414]TCP99615.1 outer membrane putative beta-barrel porin/alpha-amylase [Sphingomonas sp. PP-F2F-A104-K0414]
MKALSVALLSFAALYATSASAQDREYCPERPGLDTPACTIAPGKISVETSIADWTRDDQHGSREDDILFGDTLVRVGVSDTIEARIGWTPFGHDRKRDSTGVDTVNGVGDVSLGMKANLLNPDGSGVSVSVLPFVTLPVGRSSIGAGDWGAGFLVPLTYELSDTVSLDLTPEIDAAVDQDGNGRHLAYSSTAGLAFKVAKDFTLTGEVQALRDNDPDQHATQALAALSLAWMANDDLQLDILGAAGLNDDTPDARVYAGISRRF